MALSITFFNSLTFPGHMCSFRALKADSQRQGRFELSNNGTLFLDEIGDMPMSLQAKLKQKSSEKIFFID